MPLVFYLKKLVSLIRIYDVKFDLSDMWIFQHFGIIIIFFHLIISQRFWLYYTANDKRFLNAKIKIAHDPFMCTVCSVQCAMCMQWYVKPLSFTQGRLRSSPDRSGWMCDDNSHLRARKSHLRYAERHTNTMIDSHHFCDSHARTLLQSKTSHEAYRIAALMLFWAFCLDTLIRVQKSSTICAQRIFDRTIVAKCCCLFVNHLN